MKIHQILVLVIFVSFTFISNGQDTLAAWEVSASTSFGVSPLSPSLSHANATVGDIERAPGITTSGTGASACWGGNGLAETSLANAISQGDYVFFSIFTNTGYRLSLTEIAPYTVRLSSSGPSSGQWQYQIASGLWVNIGSAITWGTNTTATGNPQTSVNLKAIADLQNIAPNTQVAIRLVLWGASSSSGNWYINNQTGFDLMLLGECISTISQGLQIAQINQVYSIDFDNTVSGVNLGVYNGSGISTAPSSGQLNAQAWSFLGWSEGNQLFGQSQTSGDFARGTSTGGIGIGGMYAFEVLTGNYALGFQPGTGDWAPGSATLKIQNQTGNAILGLEIMYRLWERNDQNRSSSFQLMFSYNNRVFFPVPNSTFLSTQQSVTSPAWKANLYRLNLGSILIPDGNFMYIRWVCTDNSGTGSRDEFALDDISFAVSPNKCSISGVFDKIILAGTVVLDSNTYVENLNLIAGNLEVGNQILTVIGDSIKKGAGTIDAQTGTIRFRNSNPIMLPAQLFLGNIRNLIMQSTSEIFLSEKISIINTLTLMGGNIQCNGAYIEIGINTSNLGSISYSQGGITGRVRRWFNGTNSGNSSSLFPLRGSNTNHLVKVEFTTAPSAAGTIDALFVNSGMGVGGLPISVPSVGSCAAFSVNTTNQFWHVLLTDSNSLSGGIYDFSIETTGIQGASSLCDLVLLQNNSGTTWLLAGNPLQTMGNVISPILSSSQCSGYGLFGIGAGNMSILPAISALNLNITPNLKFTLVEWYMEKKPEEAYFELQKWSPSKGWMICLISSNQNSFYDSSLSFEPTVYKVCCKQGSQELICTEKETTNLKGCSIFSLYPNPSQAMLYVVMPNNGDLELSFFDIYGNCYRKEKRHVQGGIPLNLDCSDFTSGTYLLNIKFSLISKTILWIKE